MNLDSFTFGVVMVVVGMGGTILTLGLIALLLSLLTRLLPVKPEAKGSPQR